MRVLGIDHGDARIGLAVSDPSGIVATPLAVHERRKRRKQDLTILAQIAQDKECVAFVIGIPLDENGLAGKKAREVQQFAQALREASGMDVHEMDERFTTVRAHDALSTMAVPHARRRDLVDKVAAAIILQDWLDLQRVRLPEPEGGDDAA